MSSKASIGKIFWPSGLRRQFKALVFTGAGSNPAEITKTIVVQLLFAQELLFFATLFAKRGAVHPAEWVQRKAAL